MVLGEKLACSGILDKDGNASGSCGNFTSFLVICPR
jgi:hypothetical protein